jgi:hypothetical protein
VTDLDPVVAAALEGLAPRVPAVPDWSEVLARSRRFRPRWAAPALAAAAVALVAAPAFGLHGLLVGDKRPRVHFTAALRGAAGSGSFSAEPSQPFWHVERGRTRVAGFRRPIRFTLRLDAQATSARIVVAPPARGRGSGYSLPLCAPCNAETRGTLRRRGLVLHLLVGRATVVVSTPHGELRGRVLPRR